MPRQLSLGFGDEDPPQLTSPQMKGIEHLQHAYNQLAPGGRLVSVMSVGPFFRTDNKAQAFRTWLEGRDHEVEDLPDDAFQGIEAFRQTGVRTRLLSIANDPIDG